MDCKKSILSTETDPVCKMHVDKRKAKFTSEYIRERHTISAPFSVRRNSTRNLSNNRAMQISMALYYRRDY